MKTPFRRIAASFAVIAALAGSLAVTTAEAKRAQCSAIPVPGQPGHFIVVCSTTRP